MKKLLRKNQIIITALVVMVALAGYLSLTGEEELALNLTGDGTTAAIRAGEMRKIRRKMSQRKMWMTAR